MQVQKSPGKHISKYIQRVTMSREVKSQMAKTVTFKARRQLLRKQ